MGRFTSLGGGTRAQREDRKVQQMIEDMNKRLHKCQPYFDIVQDHMKEIDAERKMKEESG